MSNVTVREPVEIVVRIRWLGGELQFPTRVPLSLLGDRTWDEARSMLVARAFTEIDRIPGARTNRELFMVSAHPDPPDGWPGAV